MLYTTNTQAVVAKEPVAVICMFSLREGFPEKVKLGLGLVSALVHWEDWSAIAFQIRCKSNAISCRAQHAAAGETFLIWSVTYFMMIMMIRGLQC